MRGGGCAGAGAGAVDDYAAKIPANKEAVAYGLANVHDTSDGWPNVRAQDTKAGQLKRAAYAAYLRDTDDFRESIYRESANQAPVFADADLVLSVGDAFDPLTAVTVADPEGGPIALRPEHVAKKPAPDSTYATRGPRGSELPPMSWTTRDGRFLCSKTRG